MKLGADNCPDCGNLYSFKRGSTIGIACRIDGCEMGFVTSKLPAFATDTTNYTCYIESMPEDWMRAAAWIGNRFNLPAAQTRNFKDNKSLPLIVGKASELIQLLPEFQEHHIQIRIEPEFKYSNNDIQLDEERPLNHEELLMMRKTFALELSPNTQPSE